MISATVAIGHFHRFGAESEAKYLVAQADSEDRNAGPRQLLDRLRRVVDGGWITWTVREENAVGFEHQDVLGTRLRGNHGHSTIILREEPQNVSLYPVVVGSNVIRRPRISPGVALRGRYPRGEVESFHRRTGVERCENLGGRLRAEREHAAQHSNSSQAFGE